MKTITAIEFLKQKAVTRLINDFQDFIEIIKMNNTWADDKMFHIDKWDNVLNINIDEKFFQIDGHDLVSWCEANTSCGNISDKNITIFNFVNN